MHKYNGIRYSLIIVICFYIYKTKTGYIFRIVRYGKSVVSKQKPTLEETITYKEKWLKEHRKEIEL